MSVTALDRRRCADRPDRRSAARLALARLCAGEPLLLTGEEIDLVDLVNDAHQIYPTLLDESVDPDDYLLAEVVLDHLVHYYGIQRTAEGDRVTDVESDLRRYLLPFAIELAATLPPNRRGVAQLRLRHLEMLPQVLAGDLPTPAATVAGDRLGRVGLAAIWLPLADAAAVTIGGRDALLAAIGAGDLAVHADTRTGEQLVMALHLRQCGLLWERETPHGLSRNSAVNVLRLLRRALKRARAHGADVRIDTGLEAIEPLDAKRVRPRRPASGYTSLETIREVNARMPVIGQVVLWAERLTGARISEIFGLLVCDYFRDELGRPWLTITKQGGRRSLQRDTRGRLVAQDFKDRTKSPAGVRTIAIPELLAELLDRLIEVFHTDPETGLVELGNRLVPGIGKDDASGQSSVRSWLKRAQKDAQITSGFTSHSLRDALITDLKNAHIDERRAHFYAGHELPNATIQDKHYDLGPDSDQLLELASVLTSRLRQDGIDDLRVPTSAREEWGTQTRSAARAMEIDRLLREQGWRVAPEAHGERELGVKEVAQRIGKSQVRTRTLMRDGQIHAHTRAWGTRQVWVALDRDVDAYLATQAGVSIDELAAQAGWTYHQTRHALLSLRLLPADHAKGETVRLSAEAVESFHREVNRRQRVVNAAMPLAQAAERLNLPVVAVETLVRQQLLQLTEGPTTARGRWVTVESVADYQRRYPAERTEDTGDEVPVLTATMARKVLGLTRHQLTALTTTRQLALVKKPGNRHLYIGVHSALGYARRAGLAGPVSTLEAILDATEGPTWPCV